MRDEGVVVTLVSCLGFQKGWLYSSEYTHTYIFLIALDV